MSDFAPDELRRSPELLDHQDYINAVSRIERGLVGALVEVDPDNELLRDDLRLIAEGAAWLRNAATTGPTRTPTSLKPVQYGPRTAESA